MTVAAEQIDNELDSLEQETQGEIKIPDKFKGKEMNDVIEAYTNLEKEYGRRNNEVGQLRKLTDQLLNQELTKTEETIKEPETAPKISIDDLLDNPNDTLNSVLENSPRLNKLEQSLQQAVIDKERETFDSVHPDWKEVVGSSEFQGWLAESPSRLKMFMDADRNYDYGSGAEIIGFYKEVRQHKTDLNVAESNEKRQQSLKDVTTDTGGTGEVSKKVYRRSDLITLRIQDPDRFNAMQDEVLLAYSEGRVR